MSFNQLLDQFLGSNNASTSNANAGEQGSSGLAGIASKIPGGLAGGAAAGGIVALLMGNKSARKFAGKAAGYGGAALLGGLAFKAYQNWKQPQHAASTKAMVDASNNAVAGSTSAQSFHQQAIAAGESSLPFELTLVRAMIAAARSDGHIDADEQRRIFSAVEQMDLAVEHKAFIFDCLRQDIPLDQLIHGVESIEQKSELYLASCLVIDPDHPAERMHLEVLASALALPDELCRELQAQARVAFEAAA